MTQRYNVFIREHQIVRFSIQIETAHDVHAAIEEARKRYERSGTQWSSQAEIEIDSAQIFAVEELDPHTGEATRSLDLVNVSASVGAPIDLPT